MHGEDFAGGEFGDGDVVVVGEGQDAFAGVGGADAEVVHAAGAAQGHAALGVEAVVAQPGVLPGVAGGGGGGVWGGAGGGARGGVGPGSGGGGVGVGVGGRGGRGAGVGGCVGRGGGLLPA